MNNLFDFEKKQLGVNNLTNLDIYSNNVRSMDRQLYKIENFIYEYDKIYYELILKNKGIYEWYNKAEKIENDIPNIIVILRNVFPQEIVEKIINPIYHILFGCRINMSHFCNNDILTYNDICEKYLTYFEHKKLLRYHYGISCKYKKLVVPALKRAVFNASIHTGLSRIDYERFDKVSDIMSDIETTKFLKTSEEYENIGIN